LIWLEKDRGLAMGLNEFAGFAVGLVAFLSGYIAENMDYPYPFYLEFDFHNWILLTCFCQRHPLFVQAEVHPIKPN
jgi:hypothetical protein